MRAECTFCRVLEGTSAKVLIDEGVHCEVILDRNQAARGHLLVIPKQHVALWHDLELCVVSEMTEKAHRWARVLVEALHPDGYNLLMNNGVAAGQDVFHAHLHITPRRTGDGYYRFGGMREELSNREAAAVAELLREASMQQPHGAG